MADTVEIKYIDAQGNDVPAGSPQARYQVNPTDETSGAFVKRIQDAARETKAKPAPVSSAAPIEPVTVEPVTIEPVTLDMAADDAATKSRK